MGVSPTVVMSGLPDDGELGAVHLRAGINVEGACELFSQTTSKHWRQVRLSTKQMKFLTRADVSLRQEIRSTTSNSLERIYTMKTMKRIRQGVASMALCAAVIGGAPLALAPAANAVTGCNFWAGTDNRAYAQCSGGSGYVRAGARCKTWYGGASHRLRCLGASRTSLRRQLRMARLCMGGLTDPSSGSRRNRK